MRFFVKSWIISAKSAVEILMHLVFTMKFRAEFQPDGVATVVPNAVAVCKFRRWRVVFRSMSSKEISASNFFDEFQTYNRQEKEEMAVKLMQEYNRILGFRELKQDDPFIREAMTASLTYIEHVFDIMHLPIEMGHRYNVE